MPLMHRTLGGFVAVVSSFVSATLMAFDITPNQVEIVALPDVDHVPATLAVTYSSEADRAGLTVTSDAAWATPTLLAETGQIRVEFGTRALINRTNTATITLSRGAESDQVYIRATVSPMNIVALADDPARSRTYGVHQDGTNAGAVVVLDPISGSLVGDVTVGLKPTDLAATPDGTELLVICAASQSIYVIDLASLTLKPSIPLPTYTDSGIDSTSANIALGTNGIIYYTDGAWAPVLHVLDRSTGTVKQSVTISSQSYGFGDMAVSPDGSSLFGWGQYGWSAGLAGSLAAKFSIAGDGTLTFVETSTDTYPSGMSRDPLNTPVLISHDGTAVIIKQKAFSSSSLQTAARAFSGPVFSATPDLEVVATQSAIFDFVTGNKLYDLPVSSSVQVITSDYARLVYFNGGNHTLGTIDLLDVIGETLLGRTLAPTDGAIVLPPTELSWSPLPGVDRFRVYLGTDQAAVAAATTESGEFLGETNTPSIPLSTSLTAGQQYFWRVDSVTSAEVVTGPVHRFTVSTIAASASSITAATVQGHADYTIPIDLSSSTPAEPWSASCEAAWVRFAATSGTTPGTLAVSLDASALEVGVHRATVAVTTSAGVFSIPIELTVDPLRVTVLKSRPGTSLVYGVSEDSSASVSRAYLLEIDSATESIVRVVPCGRSVTDVAVHVPENRVYVTNWMVGSLLAFDMDTLELARTYAFTPFTSMGYGENDVYRVAAGGAGRIIVEEEDQWVDISIFDTSSGSKLASAGVREGGGQYAPNQRYYYHGENNSSGAALLKFDTLADTFTAAGSVRVDHTTYYGSRVVVVSEDGSRVFWAGGVFTPDLVEEWALKDIIFSASRTGRYACSESKIYDVDTRQATLGMPVNTQVSVFNSQTDKLVVQVGSSIMFYALGDTIEMPAPVLAIGDVTSSSIEVEWTDRSLETGFTLQWRAQGATAWNDIDATIAQNTTSFVLRSLSETTAYEFRLKADSPATSSSWSNVVTATTPTMPPGTPYLYVPYPSSAVTVSLSWWIDGVADRVLIERMSGDADWSQIASIAASSSSYLDTGVQGSTTYTYRVRTMRGSDYSAYSEAYPVTTPEPPPPPTIVTQPRSTTAFPGQPVTFSVTATGTYPLSYQWYRDGQAIYGATSRTLRFDPVGPSNEGAYTVVVSNAGGSVTSNVANLTIPSSDLATVYFGTFSGNRGRWALATLSDTTAVFAAYLTDPQGVIWATVPVDETGLVQSTVYLQTPPASAGGNTGSIALQLQAQLANGIATGSFGGTDITFAGVADAASGSTQGVSGIYSAAWIGGSPGTLYMLVGTNGDALAVIASTTWVEGAYGSADATGAVSLSSAAGTSISGTLASGDASLHASITLATGSPQVFASVLPPELRTDRLVNISSRGISGQGSASMIAGFIIDGTTPRTVLVRGAGPALEAFSVTGFADDSYITLYNAAGDPIAENDDWNDAANASTIRDTVAGMHAFAFAEGSKDAALLLDLQPGAYTAITRGRNGAGNVLTELYDISASSDSSRALVNLSIRAKIEVATEPVIAGFIVTGNSPKRMLIRAVGPTLSAFGIDPSELLADPVLSIASGATTIAENDNWSETDLSTKLSAISAASAFSLPIGSNDAVIVATLLPGSYTALAFGKGGTGIVLVEVYQLD